MESSLIIFLVWLALAAIGVIAKARKDARAKGNSTPQHRASTFDEITEYIQQAKRKAEQPGATKNVPEKKRFTPADEGIASTTPADNPTEGKAKKDGAANGKESKMDFDPVDMVIYSEIMKPGYEKY